MAVSLAPGHARTGEFEINIPSRYSIALRTNYGLPSTPCPTGPDECQLRVEQVSARWTVSKNGAVVASGAGRPSPWSYNLGDFQGDEGTYVLDLSVDEGDIGLNALAPLLIVFEGSGSSEASRNHGDWVLRAIVLLLPVGISTVVHGAILSRRNVEVSHAAGGAERRLFRWMSSMPARFGLIGANVHIILFLVIAGFVCASQYASKGLAVTLLAKNVNVPPSVGIQPLLVRVVYAGPKRLPEVQLNWKPIALKDLAATLQDEMARRPPEWPVYVQGDSELEWGDVVPVIDIIQGLGAKAVLMPRAVR